MIRSLKYEWVAAALSVILSVASVYFFVAGQFLLVYLIFILAFVSMVAGYFLLHREKLMPLLFFFVPLSLGVTVGVDAEIQMPTEPIIGLMTLFLLGSMAGLRGLFKDLRAHPLSMLLAIEIVWLLATTLTSELKLVSLKFVVIRMCYLGVFYFLAQQWIRKTDRPERLYVFYALGCVLPIANTFVTHAHYAFTPRTAYSMCKPFFNDHTVYGACMAFIIPVIIIILGSSLKKRYSALALGGLVLLLLLLLLAEFFSYSRAAWLSLFAALALGIGMVFRIKGKTVIAGILVLGLTLFFSADYLVRQLEDNKAISSKGDVEQHVKSITNIESDASNKERINRWKCAIRMGQERPLFGFGPRTYKFFYGDYQSREDMTYISTFKGNRGHAHSEYLGYLAEAGYPGFILHVSVFLAILFYGVEASRLQTDKRLRSLAIAATLGYFTYFIHGVFNGFLEDDKMASLVFFSAAVIVYCHSSIKKSTNANARLHE